MIGTSGYVFFMTWLFLLFIPSVGGVAGVSVPLHECLLRVALLVAMMAAQGVGRCFADKLVGRRVMIGMACMGAVLATLAPMGNFLSPPPVFLEYILWIAAGLGCACLGVQNLRFLTTISHQYLIICTSLSFALAAVFACLVSFLSPAEVRWVVQVILPLLAGIMAILGNMMDEERPMVRVSDSRARTHMSWKSFGAVFGHTICLGFAVYILFAEGLRSESDAIAPVLGALAIFAVSIGAAIEGVVGSGRLLDEGIQLRFTLPLAIVGLGPMFFFGPNGIIVCCCILMGVFMLQEITNMNAVAENIHLDRLNLIDVSSGSKPANAAGVAVGYLLGFVALKLGDLYGPMSSVAVVLVLIFGLSCLSSFLFKNRYPGMSGADDDFLNLGRYEDDAVAKHVGWKKRCDAFSEKIGLSPRQYEVFILLARGHNASYIARKLVISGHTVKSHTYTIYQKAMVHSKQELIEKIEAFDPSS